MRTCALHFSLNWRFYTQKSFNKDISIPISTLKTLLSKSLNIIQCTMYVTGILRCIFISSVVSGTDYSKDPNYLCYYIVCQCPFLSQHLSVLTLFRKFNLCYSLISSIFNGNLPSFKTINMLSMQIILNYK